MSAHDRLYYCTHTLKLERGAGVSLYFSLKKSSINPYSFARGRWFLRVEIYGDSNRGRGFYHLRDSSEPDWAIPGLLGVYCRHVTQHKDVPEMKALCFIPSWSPNRGDSLALNRRREGEAFVFLSQFGSDWFEINNPADADLELELLDAERKDIYLRENRFDLNHHRLVVTLRQEKA